MMLSFTLSMPNNNSWNGKWSGAEKLYVRVRNVGRRKPRPAGQEMRDYYTYSFGDGWVAGVAVKEVDAKTARSLCKRSNGFCGYEWMIDSILMHNTIRA